MKESQAISRVRSCRSNRLQPVCRHSASQHVHAVQFNDLDAVENLIKTENIACIILEPILQNIGVVKPNPRIPRGTSASVRSVRFPANF